jgi:hypothetical protein
MSSYADSCCMCCHAASFVSGTSVSWPAAAVVHWFRFANSCFRPPPLPRPILFPLTLTPDVRRLRSGPARYAAARWSWSNDLPLFRSGSVLHHKLRLSEMMKSIHCRPSYAPSSVSYCCVSAIEIPQRAIVMPACTMVFGRRRASSPRRATSGTARSPYLIALRYRVPTSRAQPAAIQNA